MNNQDFLNAVLPSTGHYCVVGIRNKKVKANFLAKHEDISEVATALSSQGVDAYFAVASYAEPTRREAANVQSVKALWLDVDVGSGKPYADRKEAVAALGEFCAAIGFLMPIIVRSGKGMHVYWPFDREVSLGEWRPVARAFKAACEDLGFHAGPERTADAASILRIPGTKHFKDPNNPRDVRIALEGDGPAPFEYYKQRLADYMQAEDALSGAKRELDPLTKMLLGNKEAKFEKILSGGKCAQIMHIYRNQEDIEEPLWRAGLSVAQVCIDRDWAIHEISKDYSGYDPAETERKASGTNGPYRCESFAQINPKGCDGCPHKGAVASPVMLGHYIAEAESLPVRQSSEHVRDEAVDHQDETEGAPSGDAGNIEDSLSGSEQAITAHSTFRNPAARTTHKFTNGHSYLNTRAIPAAPYPYFYGKDGGIYVRGKDDDEGEVLVYEHMLYITHRQTDPEDGDIINLKLHLPVDGERDIAMTLVDYSSADAFKATLAKHGVIFPNTKRTESLRMYVGAQAAQLQALERSENTVRQFGWNETFTEFTVGTTRITQKGEEYALPSRNIYPHIPAFVPQGDFGVWKDVIDFYDRPGMEQHAFAIFVGLGAPLLCFTPVDGGVLHLFNNASGAGKTTVTQVINSLWGHPKRLSLLRKDTPMAREQRMGLWKNLPATMDEMTNIHPDELSQFIYAATDGRGKNRMESQRNAERVNLTTWCLPVITTGNASFVSKLSAVKASPDGEMARVVELTLSADKTLSKEEAIELFDIKLMNNYGHAGRVFMQYVVKNKDKIVADVRAMQVALTKHVKAGNRERYWIALMAIGYVAAIHSKALGIHSIDVERVFRYMRGLIASDTRAAATNNADAISLLGDYLNANMHSILVINSQTRKNGMMMPAVKEPKLGLHIRYEPDTQDMYVSITHLRKWLVNLQVDIKYLETELNAMGLGVIRKSKRLSAGTAIMSSPVETFYLPKIGEKLNMEEYCSDDGGDTDS